MQKYIVGIFILLLYSCGANKYSPLSKYNTFEREGNYIRVNNDSAKITMLILGGHVMAQSQKEFDSIKPRLQKPINKYKGEKLFYLQNSTTKTYDCALFIDKNKETPSLQETKKFITKSIQCGNSVVSFKISKQTHKDNLKFYLENFKCMN